MKKIGIVWIAIIVLVTSLLASCGIGNYKEYEKEFVLTSPDNIQDIMLDRVDLTLNDLNLNREEEYALRKYSKYGNVLRAAAYYWPGKCEEIEYNRSIYEVGADVFTMQAISKILGINIEITQMELDEAVELLESGQIDMIPGVYLDEELEEKGQFLPKGTVTDYIYAYSVSEIYIDDITDINGLRIGIVDGINLIGPEVAESLADASIEFEIYDDYKTDRDAYNALVKDEIDIVLQTFSKDLIYEECYSVNISQIFDEYGSNILFTYNNNDIKYIMSAINKLYLYGEYMQSLQQDYMDVYAAMVVSTGSVFSLRERQYLFSIVSGEPINVLVFDDSEPYIDYDAFNGEWQGISYEVWDTVASVAEINYNIVESDDDVNGIIEKMKNGELQDEFTVVIPMYITQEKEKLFVFSEPILIDKFVIVGLDDTSNLYDIYDLANRRVGIVENVDATRALKNYLPLEDYITGFEDNDDLVNSLQDGFIDYIVLPETEFERFFYEKRFYDLEIKYEIDNVESAIGFVNSISGRNLQSIYNKVIPFIKSEQIIENFTTIDTDINDVMGQRNRDMLIMFVFMFLVVIGFLGFFLRRLTRANKKVRDIAFVNSITGLQNRTAFYNENTLATGSLIYIDLDNFKRLNDVYGHDIGDMYAYEIAQRISAIADEFGMQAYTMNINSFILLDDGTYNEDKLVSISAKILYEVTKTVRIYDVDHKLTASIGVAVRKDEKGMEELFKKVDTALFLAKERGKNRYVIASEEEFVAHRKKQFLNDALTKETIQREINPYYQPKVDIRDGRIIGVEALARWNSKEQGMIYPDEILPILAENDMLPILDISVLTKACKHYAEWLEAKIIDRSFIVSCNMSYITIKNFDIVAAIRQIHDNIGTPYRSLEIEIKEEDFISHLNDIQPKLIELAKLGVNISIDSFKADRTIMTQMSKLPINVIKVDKEMLKDGITGKVRELFELISTLTRRLNIGLIIQGVETPEEIQLLKEIPIYRVQGYYYSEAIDKDKLENELRVKFIYR